MGPIRGVKRKKNTSESESLDQNMVVVADAALSPQPEPPLNWWQEFQQMMITGPLTESEHKMKFESFFKISRRTFDYICTVVKENLATTNVSYKCGKHLPIQDQVAVALRRLSSGESVTNISHCVGTYHTTVSKVTWRFVEALQEKGLHHVCWPKVQGEMEEIKSKFERICGLPNCCGAIDITHIMITMAATDSDIWCDDMKNCSMTLQAVLDPDMRFRNVVTGWPGSLRDEAVLQSSGFFKLCAEGTYLNGKKKALYEGTEARVREYIVGDSGFPLLEWLMTPYQGAGLLDDQSEFNKKLSAAQMVGRRALVKLKDRWKLIQAPLWFPDKDKLPRIILACCILHNIIIDMEGQVVQDDMPLSRDHDAGYNHQRCGSADETGSLLRDKLSLYCSRQLHRV